MIKLAMILVCAAVLAGVVAGIILTDVMDDEWSEDPYKEDICEGFRCVWERRELCDHKCRSCKVRDREYMCEWCRWEERCPEDRL